MIRRRDNEVKLQRQNGSLAMDMNAVMITTHKMCVDTCQTHERLKNLKRTKVQSKADTSSTVSFLKETWSGSRIAVNLTNGQFLIPAVRDKQVNTRFRREEKKNKKDIHTNTTEHFWEDTLKTEKNFKRLKRTLVLA